MTSSAPRPSAPLVSAVLFALGLLAVVIVFGAAAFGRHDLPVWLNLMTMLAPLGLAVGVVSAVVRARRDRAATRG